ncbi:transglycosylase SLT domain-containing protein [Kitasatospora sp. NPDC004799]|uniref:aggregation-promoting factor C-terminal-like domain-containing protein n=1 Tax=Kitasatospora sp. NPDC004799 TaxID=3154460 RepID=UPI0033B12F1E
MQLSHARRNSLITGVATLVVASAATAALAIPQAGSTTEAAPAAAVAVDGVPVADQVPADTAAAAAAAEQAAQEARARAEADAAAQAQAQAQAQAEAQAQADAKAKADAAAAASRSQERQNLTTAYSGTPQQIAAQIVPAGQLQCFSNIVFRESSWNPLAVNASSGAYGLVQALPGSKMASAGADWRTNPATQIKWGLNYMNTRYGSPCAAWAFWQNHHWY